MHLDFRFFKAVQKVFQKVQIAANFAKLIEKSETQEVGSTDLQESIGIETENENIYPTQDQDLIVLDINFETAT